MVSFLKIEDGPKLACEILMMPRFIIILCRDSWRLLSLVKLDSMTFLEILMGVISKDWKKHILCLIAVYLSNIGNIET